MNRTSLTIGVTFLSLALMALVIWPIPRTKGTSGAVHVDSSGTWDVDDGNADDGKSGELYKQSYALIVGVSHYKYWPRLNGAELDVIKVQEVLKKHGFKVRVIMDPTRVEFDKAISDFKSKNDQSNPSRFLFYFSGHGFTQKTGAGIELGYILPSDAPLPDRDPGGFSATAMSMNEIETLARIISPSHALFVFDSCFSGSLFTTMRGVPEGISARTYEPVRLFITAGTDRQQVPDESIFRAAFVKALDVKTDDAKDEGADRNKDGYVTGSELGEFLLDNVAKDSNGAQTPRYGKINDDKLNKGDFVFVVQRPDGKPFQPFDLDSQYYPSGWMGNIVETGGTGSLAVSRQPVTIEGKSLVGTRIISKEGKKAGLVSIGNTRIRIGVMKLV